MKRRICALVCSAACLLLVLQLGAVASNDPMFSDQYGLAKVNAEPAWSVSRGGGVVIAVVDSGVKASHPDLSGKVIPGVDFFGGSSDDQNGHGTLVAGIAAASTGNGVGIAGTAPDAKIMPVRVFGPDGTAQSNVVAQAVRQAVSAAPNPRKLVLNLSFDGPPGGNLSEVEAAMNFAAASGAAVVAASGNGSGTTEYTGLNESGVIVVGASNQSDQCASFTKSGPEMDILAPGQSILSTHGQSDYAKSSGTSMAAPFVSGAIALLMANGADNVTAVNRVLSTGRGSVSCGSGSYKILDVAAAVGVSLASVGSPSSAAPAPPAAPRPQARPKPKPAVAKAPSVAPAPPPPPVPTIDLQGPREVIELPSTVQRIAAPMNSSEQTPADAWRLSAAAALVASALIFIALRVVFRPSTKRA